MRSVFIAVLVLGISSSAFGQPKETPSQDVRSQLSVAPGLNNVASGQLRIWGESTVVDNNGRVIGLLSKSIEEGGLPQFKLFDPAAPAPKIKCLMENTCNFESLPTIPNWALTRGVKEVPLIFAESNDDQKPACVPQCVTTTSKTCEPCPTWHEPDKQCCKEGKTTTCKTCPESSTSSKTSGFRFEPVK